MRLKNIFIVFLLVISALPVFSFGRQESCELLQEFTGIIRITGNEPHTKIILITADGDGYQLVGDEAEELRRYQNIEVSIEGRLDSDGHLIVSSFDSNGVQPSLPPTR